MTEGILKFTHLYKNNMHLMKKLITCLATFLLFAAAYAQPPKPPTVEERLKKLNELLQTEVKPTASQKANIEIILKTFFTEEEKLRKDNPPSARTANGVAPPPPPEKVRAAMHKLESNRDEEVRKILSEAQFNKYKTAAEKLRPPRPKNENNLRRQHKKLLKLS